MLRLLDEVMDLGERGVALLWMEAAGETVPFSGMKLRDARGNVHGVAAVSEQDGVWTLHVPEGEAAYFERLFRDVRVDAARLEAGEAVLLCQARKRAVQGDIQLHNGFLLGCQAVTLALADFVKLCVLLLEAQNFNIFRVTHGWFLPFGRSSSAGRRRRCISSSTSGWRSMYPCTLRRFPCRGNGACRPRSRRFSGRPT